MRDNDPTSPSTSLSSSSSSLSHPSSSTESDNSSSVADDDTNEIIVEQKKKSSFERLQQYNERRRERNKITLFELEEVIPALAMKMYHIPKQSSESETDHTNYNDDWWADLRQYVFSNNHPVFGICCHHTLHPIQFKARIWSLFGSIMFGLCLTNCMWLWNHYNNDGSDAKTMNEPILILRVNKQGWDNNYYNDEQNDPSYDEIRITQGMILLWTIGGGLHALYDNTIWYLEACICCLHKYDPNKPPNQNSFQCCGFAVVKLIIILVTAVTTFVVVLRASIQSENESSSSSAAAEYNSKNKNDEQNQQQYFNISNVIQDTTHDMHIENASEYEFIISYFVEMTLALFVYYPIVATIFFSGFLGCGIVPILGGRPYDIKQAKRKWKKKQQQQLQQQKKQQDEKITVVVK